ncbi:AgmX/PglI C-terminal domain-containing protein [Pyxidicoccus trucidator]|uniref:AgmX/PglI C-terminal domain-containing protein n=1 Tax=Pyxidicoccus trucidator TaxID=2709662 RepID=UPI0013DBAD46|nr:AgmX/PglI C-terminal domain-containing protein [Pyxidicoccus trucidator]
MPNRSIIRWVLIPGLSLGVLVLSAALSFWLTRPVLPEPSRDMPEPATLAPESLPAEPPSRPADPSLPPIDPPAAVPPPPFPSPRSQLPVAPETAPAGTRRVVEVEPVIESATGRIDSQDVRVALRAVTPLVQQCFEDAAQRNRGPQTVRLRFTVEPGGERGEAGQLTGGELLESTIPDPMVQACVLDSLLDARFPAPPGGGKATVVYPFEFRAPENAGP